MLIILYAFTMNAYPLCELQSKIFITKMQTQKNTAGETKTVSMKVKGAKFGCTDQRIPFFKTSHYLIALNLFFLNVVSIIIFCSCCSLESFSSFNFSRSIFTESSNTLLESVSTWEGNTLFSVWRK